MFQTNWKKLLSWRWVCASASACTCICTQSHTYPHIFNRMNKYLLHDRKECRRKEHNRYTTGLSKFCRQYTWHHSMPITTSGILSLFALILITNPNICHNEHSYGGSHFSWTITGQNTSSHFITLCCHN
jgi:hypothetical protein